MSVIGQNTVSVNSLSPEDRKTIKGAILELNDSYTRVAAERDLQKETLEQLFDKLGVEKKIVRRMARAYFKSNFSAEVEENKTFEDFYDLILKSN